MLYRIGSVLTHAHTNTDASYHTEPCSQAPFTNFSMLNVKVMYLTLSRLFGVPNLNPCTKINGVVKKRLSR